LVVTIGAGAGGVATTGEGVTGNGTSGSRGAVDWLADWLGGAADPELTVLSLMLTLRRRAG